MTGSLEFDAQTRELLCDVDADSHLCSESTWNSPVVNTDDYLGPPSHPEMLGRIGRYEIERVIGSGGMGVVFKGFDTELNRPIAIKVLARHLSQNGAARRRFAREGKAIAAVVHEHVVAIYNVETDDATPFLVMQFVNGESLQARVERCGPLDAKEILRIGMQAAAGLRAAHEQGVIHRDIKPGNILLEESVERALVTDFGLAQSLDDASLTQSGIVTGTPNYMSPEQASGKSTDARSDLFSLGSVLYFMATGRPPFRAEKTMGVLHRICNDVHQPVWRVNSDVPYPLCEIIDRLLEKKPKRRFQSAVEVERAICECLSSIQSYRPNRFVVLRRNLRLITAWKLAAVAVATALFVVGSGIVITKIVRSNHSAQQSLNAAVDARANALEQSSFLSEALEQQAWDSEIDRLHQSLDEIRNFESAPPSRDWDDAIKSTRHNLDSTLLELD